MLLTWSSKMTKSSRLGAALRNGKSTSANSSPFHSAKPIFRDFNVLREGLAPNF